ncbi:imidazole glycerol phosphate synthase [Bacillus sp. AFS023182]|uniref:imidazole glycerol phosphate synthase n=1 Tax=Bacillus sp. AFS023182 TaxID=2033492 RepID=UPI000BF55B95|nr:imidazole glycerol phosphate synthase [Bacillus sp. AFS023182]PFE04297.1 imidazole glycerol phosphate synthase [Bacillus sp. AFS023182]
MKGDIALTDKFDEQHRTEKGDYKEEYAAEVAPQHVNYNDKDEVKSKTAGSTAGFIALALALLSLFTFPTLFGLVSVLLGIYAYNRGATVTGSIAAIIGGISAIVALIFRAAIIGLFFSLF